MSTQDETDVARRALAEYGLQAARLSLINLSENATFAVEEAGRSPVILRVHREDYHSVASIESELAWVDALRVDAGVRTARVVPASDGRRVVSVPGISGDRHVVLFERLRGVEADRAELDASAFESLGAITARLHEHARRWAPPPGFDRFSWTWDTTLGERPRWGRWEDGVRLGGRTSTVLRDAASLIHARLEQFGDAPDRFGLVHADLRPANLLVDGDLVQVIDFDDCGYSWFLYDFGTAVSFLEDDPRVAHWQAAWLDGYRTVRSVSEEEEEMLATFVMFRRLLLVAWMGSHSHSREAQAMAESYSLGSERLAARYLASGGASIN